MLYAVLYNILLQCGEKYWFQNILICKMSYNIIINDLKFLKHFNHKTLCKYDLKYFKFNYSVWNKIDEKHIYDDNIHCYMLQNYNSTLFIDFITLIKPIVKRMFFINTLQEDIDYYHMCIQSDIMIKIESSETENISIDKKLFNKFKNMQKIIEFLDY